MTLGIIIIACLILLGVALMMAEIFLLPGITIAGFAGGILMIGSIVYAFQYMGAYTGYITVGANVVIFGLVFIFLVKSKTLDRIALNTNIDAKVDQAEIKQLQVGQTGIALSRLNPIGKAEFGEFIVEAKSFTGEFIDVQEPVEIVRIDSYNVLVQPVIQKENNI